MTSEHLDEPGEQSDDYHPAGVALLLEALGAVPESCIDILRENGFEVQPRGSDAQQRLGSNVVELF